MSVVLLRPFFLLFIFFLLLSCPRRSQLRPAMMASCLIREKTTAFVISRKAARPVLMGGGMANRRLSEASQPWLAGRAGRGRETGPEAGGEAGTQAARESSRARNKQAKLRQDDKKERQARQQQQQQQQRRSVRSSVWG